jgi:hypothetical protein
MVLAQVETLLTAYEKDAKVAQSVLRPLKPKNVDMEEEVDDAE